MLMEDWTIDELVVSAITLEHDLRGSWNSNYTGRIFELIHVCERIIDIKIEKKDKFVNALKATPNYYDAAMHDIDVSHGELDNEYGYDGRVFRDAGGLYDMTMPEKGKTKRVIEFLEITVECDDYHWFQRD